MSTTAGRFTVGSSTISLDADPLTMMALESPNHTCGCSGNVPYNVTRSFERTSAADGDTAAMLQPGAGAGLPGAGWVPGAAVVVGEELSGAGCVPGAAVVLGGGRVLGGRVLGGRVVGGRVVGDHAQVVVGAAYGSSGYVGPEYGSSGYVGAAHVVVGQVSPGR